MNAPSLAADHLFRLMVEQNTMGITLTDRNGIIIYANPRQLDASGYTLDEVVGQNPRIFSAGETPREVYETLWTTILAGRIWYGELTNRRKNGEICRELLRIAPIRNDAGEISHFFAVKEENPFGNIQHLLSGTVATVDPLTGLSNRAMLVDKLDRLLQVTPETNAKPFAVLAVDIDQFRAINESIGQQAADELLMCLAVRLQQCVRQSDVVARIGSNQFVLLIPGEENETQLEDLVRRLLLSIATPAMIQGRKIIATASIGVARSPLDGKHTDLLLQCADSALTAAKNAGGDDFCFYAPPVEQVAKDWSNLREALRDVTERNELVLHYQPKVDLRSGQVIGLEALLRWQHPEHGLLAPSRFIPIAEETGLIVKLSQWVISNVLHQLRDWQQAGRPPITVGVNLSLRHFRANDLPGFIAAELAATGVDPSLLELEISENTIMQDPTQSFILVDRLKSLGIRLALDDFGTRLSSLSYLSRMNVPNGHYSRA